MWRRLWTRFPALVLCVAAGLAASAVLLAGRVAVERSYRTVEITVDGDDWATLTRLRGVEREALYGDLYQHGVRSVTIYAASLRRLSDAGLITFNAGSDAIDAARAEALAPPLARLAGRLRADATYVQGPPALLELIRGGITMQRGADAAGIAGPGVLEIAGRGRDLEDLSLGMVPEEIAAARRAHLATELRVRNFREVAPGGIEAFFASLGQFGQAFTLIFDRDQVLGYDALVPDVASAIKAHGFVFGRIEAFTARRRQKGEEQLALLAAPHVIRVFSLAPEELAGLTPAQARDKFVLAAHERNVRILYVRPFLSTSAGVDPIQANLEYVGSIADELTRSGYKLGKAVPLPVVGTPAPWFALAALGALAAGALATAETGGALGYEVRPAWLYAGVAAGLVITLATMAVHHVTLWRELVALLAALAFPILAMLWFVPGARRETWPADTLGAGGTASRTPARDPNGAARVANVRLGGRAVLARSLAGLWVMSAASALGGFMVAALLAEWSFMMEARIFLGVKVLIVLPVVIVGLAIAAAQAGPEGVWPRVREWLRQPLRLEYGILLIVIGGAALFALGRTGNTGLPALGGLEVKVRTVLERVLVARPRTKEFLIGHPAMMLAIAVAFLGARRWVLPLAMAGAVGQTNLVDSFSHIHTPLVYVVERTVYALVIGSMIGAVFVGALLWSRRWWRLPAGGRDAAGGPAPDRAPATPTAGSEARAAGRRHGSESGEPAGIPSSPPLTDYGRG
ncbi:MAG TPA: DUF5693 family protein [bacterium]|nr:DUF5693 family protein [bacterium]